MSSVEPLRTLRRLPLDPATDPSKDPRLTATYFLPDGDSVTVPTRHGRSPIAATLDATAVQSAIKEAQQLVPGYTHVGFSGKVWRLDVWVISSRSHGGALATSVATLKLTSNAFRNRCRSHAHGALCLRSANDG